VKTLTVAEAARNLDSWLKVVHEEHESYELVKGGVPYARLVPVPAENCSSRDLADDLAGIKLGIEDRKEMAAAVRKGRKQLKPLKNPWD
jgi:antitoxin (DNA-binding transcriptional repressor) of toxin-antitoxin stability system